VYRCSDGTTETYAVLVRELLAVILEKDESRGHHVDYVYEQFFYYRSVYLLFWQRIQCNSHTIFIYLKITK